MKRWIERNRSLIVLNSGVFLCLITAWISYALFGHRLIEAMYNGESMEFLNSIIEGQSIHPLAKYLEGADEIMWMATVRVIVGMVVLSSLVTVFGIFIRIVSGRTMSQFIKFLYTVYSKWVVELRKSFWTAFSKRALDLIRFLYTAFSKVVMILTKFLHTVFSKPVLMPQSEFARRRHVAFLLGITLCYVTFLFVFRWMHLSLFDPQSSVINFVWYKNWDNVGKQSLAETLYLVYMACLPPTMWAVVLYFLFVPFARFLQPMVVAFLLFLALAVMHLDMWWYQLSRQHGSWREVQLLLTLNKDIQENWGVTREQIDLWLQQIANHAAVVTIIWVASGALAYFLPPFPKLRLRVKHLGLILLPAIAADILAVGYSLSRDKGQWIDLSARNPVRLTVLDHLAKGVFRRDQDLEAANAALLALRQTKASRDFASRTPIASAQRTHSLAPNVLLISVEGFNPNYADSASMPFWTQLGRRSIVLRNHYSTGNFTEFGILGLLYGSPPIFSENLLSIAARAPAENGMSGSSYIDIFARRGYQTRIISTPLGPYSVSGALNKWWNIKYLGNFTRPTFYAKDCATHPRPICLWLEGQHLIPVLLEELRTKEPRLVFTYYRGTVYPYDHASKYTVFTPELPDTFDYGREALREHKQATINRYKNSLAQFDDWLRTLITQIDLERTIVVVTGDHGEEMFENGRFGHSNSLGEPQIRTSLLMYVPGIPGRVVEEVTSHADLMPTLMDALGWNGEVRGFGRSIFAQVPVRSAVIANFNLPNPAKKWAVVTGDVKTIVHGLHGRPVQILELRDKTDRRIQFGAPARWQENFEEVLRFENYLLSGQAH